MMYGGCSVCMIQLYFYVMNNQISTFLCNNLFQANKVKNKSKDVFGTKLGRVHMTKQDYGKLQTRKMKGLKKTSQNKKLNAKNSSGEEACTSEPMVVDQQWTSRGKW